MATETEIEAMARALSHQAQEDPNVMWRNWTSQAAVAANALDRVRADAARDTAKPERPVFGKSMRGIKKMR